MKGYEKMDKLKNGVCKDVYESMAQMKRTSIRMRSEALSETVSFEKSKEIRKEQNNIYNKWQFYQKFINAVNKRG
jgi:hypothetical protein